MRKGEENDDEEIGDEVAAERQRESSGMERSAREIEGTNEQRRTS